MPARTLLSPLRLNIEECPHFLARDPAWQRKLGLGVLWGLLSFTIIGAFFVQGYLLLMMERVARAEPLPLPEWNDYGGLLRRLEPLFILTILAATLLLTLRTIGDFFFQLRSSHLLGQLCWYDRSVMERRPDGH